MVKWIVIGFLAVCLILFLSEIGRAMDYDPAWDDVEIKPKENNHD